MVVVGGSRSLVVRGRVEVVLWVMPQKGLRLPPPASPTLSFLISVWVPLFQLSLGRLTGESFLLAGRRPFCTAIIYLWSWRRA